MINEDQRHKRIKKVVNENGQNEKKKRLNKACQYCREKYLEKKRNGEEVDWDKMVHRTEMVCSICDVFLCANHFEKWHNSIDHS